MPSTFRRHLRQRAPNPVPYMHHHALPANRCSALAALRGFRKIVGRPTGTANGDRCVHLLEQSVRLANTRTHVRMHVQPTCDTRRPHAELQLQPLPDRRQHARGYRQLRGDDRHARARGGGSFQNCAAKTSVCILSVCPDSKLWEMSKYLVLLPPRLCGRTHEDSSTTWSHCWMLSI